MEILNQTILDILIHQGTEVRKAVKTATRNYTTFDGLTCDYCGGDGGFTWRQNSGLEKHEVCCDQCFALGVKRFKILK